MSDTDTAQDAIPEGFGDMPIFGPSHEMVGKTYHLERDDKTVVGIRMEEKHRNAGQMVHGGILMFLVDTAMTMACRRIRTPDSFLVTTTLNNEFIAAARPGDWLEAEVSILRAGRKMAFLDCHIRRDGPDGQLIMHSSGTFQFVVPK